MCLLNQADEFNSIPASRFHTFTRNECVFNSPHGFCVLAVHPKTLCQSLSRKWLSSLLLLFSSIQVRSDINSWRLTQSHKILLTAPGMECRNYMNEKWFLRKDRERRPRLLWCLSKSGTDRVKLRSPPPTQTPKAVNSESTSTQNRQYFHHVTATTINGIVDETNPKG